MFARRRAKTVATVRALDEAGWARSGTHETYGRLDVAGLLRLADRPRREPRGVAVSRLTLLSRGTSLVE